MLDSKGVIQQSRENLSPEKAQFATKRNLATLEEALVDADVFIGLSQPNIVSASMLQNHVSKTHCICHGQSRSRNWI